MDKNTQRNFMPQGKLKQVNATVLTPENAGLRLVINACGQNGKFESKLDLMLTKRWSRVRTDFKEWYATQLNFKMGSLNTTAVASDTWVVNMLVEGKDGKIDDKGLQLAAKELGRLAKAEQASVHVSSILINEAPALQQLLVSNLIEQGINVYIYTEPVA